MNKNKKNFLLIVLMLFPSIFFSKDIDLRNRGLIGDGVYDNWEKIQRAIDEVANAGGGKLYFSTGNFAIYNKSLVIWGNGVELIGQENGATKIIKKGKVGYFGDCIDISGKIKGYQYYGKFGKGNYNIIRFYRGETQPVTNVKLENLIITTALNDKTSKRYVANNLGIINSRNIEINNCIISDAPQTNVAMVNDTEQFRNEKITFNNCLFTNSYQHSVRVISYNTGTNIGNDVTFNNCIFNNVLGGDVNQKEIINQKVHLWYRGGDENGKTKLNMNNCYIDNSGIIFANSNANGLTIKNSTINTAVQVQHSYTFGMSPNIQIENNKFIITKKFETNFIKERFRINHNIYLYPKGMNVNSVKVKDNIFISSSKK